MLDIPKMRFSSVLESLKSTMTEINLVQREKFSNVNAKLFSLNPMAVLARGYSVVYDENYEIVKSSKLINNGDKIKIKMCDGELNATVAEDEK